MKGEKWKNAEEYLKELSKYEEAELDRFEIFLDPLDPRVPPQQEHITLNRKTVRGRESHSSGLGSFLRSKIEYDGDQPTAQ